jgi:hypothetical protein
LTGLWYDIPRWQDNTQRRSHIRNALGLVQWLYIFYM